jgi:hypothetical protein
MPFNGSGVFNRTMDWTNDAAALIKVRADRHDNNDDDIAAGLSKMICRDGQSQVSADIPWNGFKITGLANPINPQDAATKDYADNLRTYNSPIILSGADANGRVRFSAAAGSVLGLEFVAADLFFGVKGVVGSNPRWVWNDAKDGTGTDQMVLSEAGALTVGGAIVAGGNVTASAAFVVASTNAVFAPNVAGQVILRPAGTGSTTAQVIISQVAVTAAAQDFTVKSLSSTGVLTAGAATISGAISGTTISCGVGAGFNSADANLRLGPGSNGQLILQPAGMGNTTGQVTITGAVISAAAQDATFKSVTATGGASAFGTMTSGSQTITGALTTTGGGVTLLNNTRTDVFAAYTAGSATRGVSLLDGGTSVTYRSNASINTAVTHMAFANLTNGQVGSISTNGTATAYNVSSDAVLKNVIGNYDPLLAIDIIRRDPVVDWNFKSDGSYAVGWVAQHSYTVSADLATPGNDKDPTDPEFEPWGVDQSKRTPYLWAALTWALDQIDALTARVTTLEGAGA